MSETILLVDDNPRLLSGTRLALELNGFTVFTASNGNEAIREIQANLPDLVVSNIILPDCDGFSLLEMVHARPECGYIPFLFLSTLDDLASLDRSRVLAADDYLNKPFTPTALVRAVRGRLDRALADQNANFSDAYLETIFMIVKAIEARDLFSGKHIERVADYATLLARTLRWPDYQIGEVYRSAILHDIGKIAIPDAILNKAGQLTPEEWELVKFHPVRGMELLLPLQHLPVVLLGVRNHHERYDGRGYPDGLAGEDIPPIGRLLAIADAFDAMTSERAYRKAMSKDRAIQCLLENAGTQFDPNYVRVFVDLPEIRDMSIPFLAAG